MQDNDNRKLARELSARCPKPNKIKLPSHIGFHEVGDGTVRLNLGERCVLANMQEDKSSFEGWALALKRWVPERVKRIEIAWESTADSNDAHYQRFLFRLARFAELFDWFGVANSESACELAKLRTGKNDIRYFITTAKKPRPVDANKAHPREALYEDEHLLECEINKSPAALKTLLSIEEMDRQFPVGVFENEVKRGANEIFPRGHSAIDLLGINGNDIFVFELKALGNVKVGILSELFFYSCIVEGIQTGQYALQEGKNDFKIEGSDIIGRKDGIIRALMLTPDWHPLVDEELIGMVNRRFRELNRRIRFGIVRILTTGCDPAFEVVVNSCN